MAMTRSNSSIKGISFVDRVRQWAALARMHVIDNRGPADFSGLRNIARIYGECLQGYGNGQLAGCRAVEVGYGARPRLLYWLTGLGVDVTGIDIDRPLINGTPSEFVQIARTNGWERALKSLTRFLLVDRRYWREL